MCMFCLKYFCYNNISYDLIRALRGAESRLVAAARERKKKFGVKPFEKGLSLSFFAPHATLFNS